MPPPIPEVGGAPPPLYYEAHQMPGSALLSKASGLVVYYLIPTKDTAPKIIAFRGTEPTASDIAADATPEGVGKSVFELHKKEIKSMLDKMTSSRGSKLVVVGHSLGGAMAQWTTAEFPGQINETVTFNSPGISREASKKFEKNSSAQKNKPEVFHYVTRGDIVSTSGQTPLPGKVTMMEGNATRKLEAMLERGAIRQINDALLSLLTAINILAQGEAGNSRLAVVAYILGKLYVSGVFDEFEEFGTLLGQLHSQRLLGVSELQAERSKNPLPRFASLSSLNKNVKPPATDLEELEQDAGHVIKTPKQVNQINIASIEKARVVLGKSGFIGDVYTLFNQTIPSISILKKNLAKTVGMEVSNVSVLAPIAKQVQPLLTKLVIVVYGFGGLQSFVQKALYYRGVAEPDKTGVASPLIDEKLIQRSSPR
jgi:hypothetical protein